jgi:hypothetical protein
MFLMLFLRIECGGIKMDRDEAVELFLRTECGGIKMDRDEAVEYLKRKGKEPTEENIKKVQRLGKCFGDPKVVISDDW